MHSMLNRLKDTAENCSIRESCTRKCRDEKKEYQRHFCDVHSYVAKMSSHVAEEIKCWQKEFDGKEVEIREQSERHKNERSQDRQKMEAELSELSKLKTENEEIRKKNSSMQSDRDKANGEVLKLRLNLQKLVNWREQETKRSQQEVQGLNNQLNEQKRGIELARQDAAHAHNQLSTMREDLEKKTHEYETLQAKFDQLQQKKCDQCAELMAKIKQLEANRKQQLQQLRKECVQCKKWEQDYATLESNFEQEDLARKKAEILVRSKKRLIEELQSENNQLKAKYGELEEQLLDSREEVATLNASALNHTNEAEMDELRSDLADKDAKCEQLEHENRRIKLELKKYKDGQKKQEFCFLDCQNESKRRVGEVLAKKHALDEGIADVRRMNRTESPQKQCQNCPILQRELNETNFENRHLKRTNKILLDDKHERERDTWSASTESNMHEQSDRDFEQPANNSHVQSVEPPDLLNGSDRKRQIKQEHYEGASDEQNPVYKRSRLF